MSFLLSDIESAVRQDLFDPIGANQRWAASDIDRAIDKAVSRYSEYYPNVVYSDLASQPFQRTYPYPTSWNSNYPVLWIERILYPLQVHGSAFVPFFRDWILTNYLNRAGDVYHYNGLDLGANVGGTQLPGFHPLSAPPASLRPFGSAAFSSSGRTLGGSDAPLVGGWF